MKDDDKIINFDELDDNLITDDILSDDFSGVLKKGLEAAFDADDIKVSDELIMRTLEAIKLQAVEEEKDDEKEDTAAQVEKTAADISETVPEKKIINWRKLTTFVASAAAVLVVGVVGLRFMGIGAAFDEQKSGSAAPESAYATNGFMADKVASTTASTAEFEYEDSSEESLMVAEAETSNGAYMICSPAPDGAEAFADGTSGDMKTGISDNMLADAAGSMEAETEATDAAPDMYFEENQAPEEAFDIVEYVSGIILSNYGVDRSNSVDESLIGITEGIADGTVDELINSEVTAELPEATGEDGIPGEPSDNGSEVTSTVSALEIAADPEYYASNAEVTLVVLNSDGYESIRRSAILCTAESQGYCYNETDNTISTDEEGNNIVPEEVLYQEGNTELDSDSIYCLVKSNEDGCERTLIFTDDGIIEVINSEEEADTRFFPVNE